MFSTGREEEALVSYRTRSQMFLMMRLLRWKCRFIKGALRSDQPRWQDAQSWAQCTAGNNWKVLNFSLDFLYPLFDHLSVGGFFAGSFKVSIFIDLGCRSDLGKHSGCLILIRWPISWFVTARKRSLRRLCFHRCLSVYRGCLPHCMLLYTPGDQRQTPPPPLCSACWDTINKWAVRIPLECILVISDVIYCQHADVKCHDFVSVNVRVSKESYVFWSNCVRPTLSFCLSVCLLRVCALCPFAYLLWSRLFVTRCSQLQNIRNEIFLHRHYLHELPQIWHLHCNRHWTDFSFHFSVAFLGFYFGVMYHLYYESQYIRQGTNFNAFSEFLFIPLSFILSPFFLRVTFGKNYFPAPLWNLDE